VVGLGELWCRERAGVPDGDKVVVSSGGELSTISSPLKTTDFGSVGDELGSLVLSDAYVVVEDKSRSGTSGKSVLVPSHNTNTSFVSVHAAELGTLLNIPDLNLSRTETDTDICSVTRPLDTANIGIWASLEERADSS